MQISALLHNPQKILNFVELTNMVNPKVIKTGKFFYNYSNSLLVQHSTNCYPISRLISEFAMWNGSKENVKKG